MAEVPAQAPPLTDTLPSSATACTALHHTHRGGKAFMISTARHAAVNSLK